jgi:hypothetical protein
MEDSQMDEEKLTIIEEILSQIEELEDNIETNVGEWQQELLNIRLELRNIGGEAICD